MKIPMVHRRGPLREGTGRAVHPSFMKSLLGLVPYLLVSLVLLAAAVFFLGSAQRAEMMATQYMRATEAVRTTGMLTVQWRLEVENIRNEIDSNFDALTDLVGRMDHQVRIIRDSQNTIPDLPADVDETLDDYVQHLKARKERIGRFKSGFAIVRNLRRFVLQEGAVLAEAARDGGYGKVEAATRQLLERTQSFLKQPTESQPRWMEQSMSTLAESADGTALHTRAETLNRHVSLLLRHHEPIRDIMRTDLEDLAERIVGLLDATHRRYQAKRRYFGYGFQVSLGLAVLCWGVPIARRMGGAGRWKMKIGSGRGNRLRRKPLPRDMGTVPAPAARNAKPPDVKEVLEQGAAVTETRVIPSDGGGDTPVIGGPDPATEERPMVEEATRVQPAQPPDGAELSTALSEGATRVQPAQPPEPAPAEVREKKDAVEEFAEAASIASGVRKDPPGEAWMANVQNGLHKVMGIDGAIGVALVDVDAGLTLAMAGGGEMLDIEAAGAGNLEVIRAKMQVIEQLGLDDRIEDILITLGRQYHLIRPLDRDSAGLFLFVALDRERSNLGMARHQLNGIEVDGYGIS